jgi:phage gp46-like protein
MALLTVKKLGGADFTSLTAAHAAASDGDFIEIQDSESYNERLTITVDNLTVYALTGFSPVIYYAQPAISIANTLTAFSIYGTAGSPIRLKTVTSSGATISFGGATNITAHDLEFVDSTTQKCFNAATASTGIIAVTDCVLKGVGANGSIADLRLLRCTGTVQELVGYSSLGGWARRCNVTCVGTGVLKRFGGSNKITAFTVSACYFVMTTSGAEWAFKNDSPGLLIENCTVINTTAGTAMGFADFINQPAAPYVVNCITGGFAVGISAGAVGAFGDYNCMRNVDDYAGGVTAGAHDFTSDPLLTGYIIDPSSPCRNAGTTSGYPYDIDGTTRPKETAFDIGAYEYDPPRPSIVSAASVSNTVRVTLDKAIDAATVGAPGAWTVQPLHTGALVTVVSVSYLAGSLIIDVEVTAGMTSIEWYRVTAPATVATPEGGLIDVRTADFVVPRYLEAESSGILNAALDGTQIDFGEGYFELVPWGADVPGTDLTQLIFISLFTDRFVEKDELLASDTGDQAGWWADAYSGVEKIGSKLHLLRRKLPTAANIQQAKIHCFEALQWMLDDGLLAKVEVEIKRTGIGAAEGTVAAYEQDGTKKVIKYADFWRLLGR